MTIPRQRSVFRRHTNNLPGYWGRAMANGWTSERRARQSEAIRRWRPWERSTGPKTAEGKAKVSRNGYKGGWRELLPAGAIPSVASAGKGPSAGGRVTQERVCDIRFRVRATSENDPLLPVAIF